MTPFIALVIAGGLMLVFVFTAIVIIVALDNFIAIKNAQERIRQKGLKHGD